VPAQAAGIRTNGLRSRRRPCVARGKPTRSSRFEAQLASIVVAGVASGISEVPAPATGRTLPQSKMPCSWTPGPYA
jgi:hypothetical protein